MKEVGNIHVHKHGARSLRQKGTGRVFLLHLILHKRNEMRKLRSFCNGVVARDKHLCFTSLRWMNVFIFLPSPGTPNVSQAGVRDLISLVMGARFTHSFAAWEFSSLSTSRRMKRNPHVLDVKVCRAVLWWNILGEAMDAAREAGKRRSRRRETKRLVIALAISQRRAGGERPSSSSYQGKEIEYSCSLSSLQSEDVDESLSPYPSSAGMGHNSPLSCLKEGFYPEDFVSEEMEWSAVPASFRWRMEQWRPPAPSAFVKMEDDDHDGREVGLRVEDAEEQGDLEAAGWQRVHLDEAAVLRRVYDYL